METDKPRIVNTTQLKEDDVLLFHGSTLTVKDIKFFAGDAVRITFDRPYFDALTEKWYRSYTCNSGFCFQLV